MTCAGGCGRQLVGRPEFKALSPEGRRGKARRETATLCGACYARDWRRAHHHPREGRWARAELLEEVAMVVDGGQTHPTTVASRLGVTEKALHQALYRASRAGLVEADRLRRRIFHHETRPARLLWETMS